MDSDEIKKGSVPMAFGISLLKGTLLHLLRLSEFLFSIQIVIHFVRFVIGITVQQIWGRGVGLHDQSWL